MLKIPGSHGQRKRGIKLLQRLFAHLYKTVKYGHIPGLVKFGYQRIRFDLIGLSGIHRINAICFYPCEFLFCDCSQNHISNSCADNRFLIFLQELHTLYCRIRPLIELSQQIFHRKYSGTHRNLQCFLIQLIHRRLRKNGSAGPTEYFLRNILHIITDKYSDAFHPDSQKAFDILPQLLCFYGKRLLFLHIDTSDHSHVPPFSIELSSRINPYPCLLSLRADPISPEVPPHHPAPAPSE